AERIRTADLDLRGAREMPARLDDLSLEDVEALMIKKALSRHGNVTEAARARPEPVGSVPAARAIRNPVIDQDRRILLLNLAAGFPAVIAAMVLLWLSPYPL